jgi:hypothetical protein
MDQQSRLVVRSGTFPTCFTAIRRNNAARGTVTLMVCCAIPGPKRSSPITAQQNKLQCRKYKIICHRCRCNQPAPLPWIQVAHWTGRVENVPRDDAKIQIRCEYKYAGDSVYKLPSEIYWRDWLARRPAHHALVHSL